MPNTERLSGERAPRKPEHGQQDRSVPLRPKLRADQTATLPETATLRADRARSQVYSGLDSSAALYAGKAPSAAGDAGGQQLYNAAHTYGEQLRRVKTVPGDDSRA